MGTVDIKDARYWKDDGLIYLREALRNASCDATIDFILAMEVLNYASLGQSCLYTLVSVYLVALFVYASHDKKVLTKFIYFEIFYFLVYYFIVMWLIIEYFHVSNSCADVIKSNRKLLWSAALVEVTVGMFLWCLPFFLLLIYIIKAAFLSVYDIGQIAKDKAEKGYPVKRVCEPVKFPKVEQNVKDAS